MLVTSRAGWVLRVRVSSSSGPSKHSFERENPRVSSASAKVSRTMGCWSYRAFPIPTYCEPCPGKTAASLSTRHTLPCPLQHAGRPREPAAETDEHHQVARGDPPLFHRLVQGDGDRCGRGIAVFMHVGEHPVSADAQPLRRGVDDPDVRLVRDEQP